MIEAEVGATWTVTVGADPVSTAFRCPAQTPCVVIGAPPSAMSVWAATSPGLLPQVHLLRSARADAGRQTKRNGNRLRPVGEGLVDQRQIDRPVVGPIGVGGKLRSQSRRHPNIQRPAHGALGEGQVAIGFRPDCEALASVQVEKGGISLRRNGAIGLVFFARVVIHPQDVARRPPMAGVECPKRRGVRVTDPLRAAKGAIIQLVDAVGDPARGREMIS